MPARTARDDAGFSLPEVMISMGIMLVVLGGTFTAMTNAMRAEQTARSITTVNGHLRTSMDLLVRDFLQIGQGLQTGRVITVPNGPGSTPIVRPGPAASGACAGVANFPVDPTISAVTVGPDLGPPINGQCTDVINTLAIDGAFENVNVAAMAANGQSITVRPRVVRRLDIADAFGDNLRVGDLLELRRRGTSDTATSTSRHVAGQVVTFTPGDPLGLNQFDTTGIMEGTTNKIFVAGDPVAPVVVAGVTQAGPWDAFRIRMISYFVNTTANPASPRLVRQINGNAANAVAFEHGGVPPHLRHRRRHRQPVGRAHERGRSRHRRRLRPVRLFGQPDPQGQRHHGRCVRSGAARRRGSTRTRCSPRSRCAACRSWIGSIERAVRRATEDSIGRTHEVIVDANANGGKKQRVGGGAAFRHPHPDADVGAAHRLHRHGELRPGGERHQPRSDAGVRRGARRRREADGRSGAAVPGELRAHRRAGQRPGGGRPGADAQRHPVPRARAAAPATRSTSTDVAPADGNPDTPR